MKYNKNDIYITIIISLFSALIFISTSILIPLPTGNFIHLGHTIFILINFLLIKYKKKIIIIIGILGFTIFNFLHGYIIEIPYFVLETIILTNLLKFLYNKFFKNNNYYFKKKIFFIIIIIEIIKIFLIQINYIFINIILYNLNFKIILISSIFKLLATLINSIITIILVPILYIKFKNFIK